MPTYTAISDLTPRLGGRTISATVEPTTTAVTAWLDQAEAELLGTFAACGVETSYAAASRGFLTITAWVADYVAGMVRGTNAAAGGDGSNRDGEELIKAWRARLADIRKMPEHYGAMLNAGGSSPARAVLLSSHVTDGLSGYDSATAFLPSFNIKGNDF